MANILHITEAGGGVLEVIKNLADLDRVNKHSLLVRRRDFSSNALTEFTRNMDIFYWKGPLIFAFREYRTLKLNYPFDVIHFHSSRAGVLRMLFFGKRKVYSPHCFAFERTDLNKFSILFILLIEKFLMNFTHGFLAVNGFEYQWATNLKSILIVSQHKYVAKIQLRKEKKDLLIVVGRICTQKNPMEVIRIVKELRNKHYNFEVIWIGDGQEDLTSLLIQNGIQVTGWLKSREVYDYLKSSTALLHTAKWEGMPIVFFEAWATGIPIFALNANYLNGISKVRVFNTTEEAVELLASEFDIPSEVPSFIIDRDEAMTNIENFYQRVIGEQN